MWSSITLCSRLRSFITGQWLCRHWNPISCKEYVIHADMKYHHSCWEITGACKRVAAFTRTWLRSYLRSCNYMHTQRNLLRQIPCLHDKHWHPGVWLLHRICACTLPFTTVASAKCVKLQLIQHHLMLTSCCRYSWKVGDKSQFLCCSKSQAPVSLTPCLVCHSAEVKRSGSCVYSLPDTMASQYSADYSIFWGVSSGCKIKFLHTETRDYKHKQNWDTQVYVNAAVYSPDWKRLGF